MSKDDGISATKRGIHGDRSAWRLRKIDEPDALAETIRRLVP